MHRLGAIADQLAASPASPSRVAASGELRAGIIGLDTSHSVAFSKALNADDKGPELCGCRIVAAVPRGSADIESSVERIPGYIEEVTAVGVKVVETIEEMLELVDVVFLETNDGRPRLAQAMPVLLAGKPMFIDKPVSASLEDTLAIYAVAKKLGVPIFSSSSLRWADGALEARNGDFGAVLGCDVHGACSLENTQPDLFWYGIHGVEMLFTVMGTGCATVARSSTENTDLCVGTWEDGRVGSFRGMRDKYDYGGNAFGADSIKPLGGSPGYEIMLVAILEFFRTHVAPMTEEETMQIYAFMIAADASKMAGGAPVSTATVLAEAKIKAQRIVSGLLGDDAPTI